MKTLMYLGLTLAACRLFAQSPNPAWRHLPPDAAAIYHFNLVALTGKIPWYALAAPIPTPQRNTDNRELVAILRTPDKAGVDVRRDLFIIQSGRSPKDTGETTSFLFELDDTARWTAFLRTQDPGLHLLTQEADTGYASRDKVEYAGREKMGVAWNSQYAVLTFVHGLSHSGQPGETRRLAIHRSLTLLRGYDDSSSIRDPLFLTGFANDADIQAWTRPGQLLYAFLNFLLPTDHPLITRSTSAAGPCLHTLSAVRFEKGRITLSSVICLPSGADSIYARLIDHPLSAHIAARLPQTATLGLCSLHFNPGLVADLLTELQTRGATEELLFDKGLSLESFAHGFQGDFAVIATPSDAAHGPLPFTLSLAASTLDQPAVRQWTNSLHPSGCTLSDSLLWIGPMPDNLQTRNNTQTTDHPDTFMLTQLRDPSAPLSGYLDCKTLARYWKGMPLLSVMDKLTFTAGRLNPNGQIENHFELTLTDPSAYSLQTLWPLLGP
jgi:Domain of unknown function (DUF4836)